MQITSLLLLAGFAVLMTFVMEANCDDYVSGKIVKKYSEDEDEMDGAAKKFFLGLFNLFGRKYKKKPAGKPAPSNVAALKGADPLLLSSWQKAYGKDWYTQFRSYLKQIYGDNWYKLYRQDLKKKLGAEKWQKIKGTEKYRERYYMIKYGDEWNTYYTDFMKQTFGDEWKNDVQNFYTQNGLTPDFSWSSSDSESGTSNGDSSAPAQLNGADPLLISSWQKGFGKNWYNPFRNYLKATYGDNWYHDYRQAVKQKLGAEKWKQIKSTEKYRERYYMVKYGDEWQSHYTTFMEETFGDNWKTDVVNFYKENNLTPDFTWTNTVVKKPYY